MVAVAQLLQMRMPVSVAFPQSPSREGSGEQDCTPSTAAPGSLTVFYRFYAKALIVNLNTM